jgi:hypothetical protein
MLLRDLRVPGHQGHVVAARCVELTGTTVSRASE